MEGRGADESAASTAATRKSSAASPARCVLAPQVRVRHAPRATRAGDRGAGPHPHLGVHGGDPARAGRVEDVALNPRSCASTPTARRARAASTSTRPTPHPHHAPADRHRGRVPGRALAAQESLAGDVAAAREAARDRAQKQAAQQAQQRKLQVGSGDRSERIRTYNYPQGRVTDHRINLTLYQLPAIVDGALEEVIARCSRSGRPSSWPRSTDGRPAHMPPKSAHCSTKAPRSSTRRRSAAPRGRGAARRRTRSHARVAARPPEERILDCEATTVTSVRHPAPAR